MDSRQLWILAAALVCGAPSAAQGQGLEFGADLGLGYTRVGGADLFEAATPTSLRLGIPLASQVRLEPRMALAIVQGDADFSAFSVIPAILVASGHERRGVYFGVLPGFSVSDGDVQGLLGAAVGVRMPRTSQWGLRLEAQYMHGFSGDVPAVDALRVLIGISFFTAPPAR